MAAVFTYFYLVIPVLKRSFWVSAVIQDPATAALKYRNIPYRTMKNMTRRDA